MDKPRPTPPSYREGMSIEKYVRSLEACGREVDILRIDKAHEIGGLIGLMMVKGISPDLTPSLESWHKRLLEWISMDTESERYEEMKKAVDAEFRIMARELIRAKIERNGAAVH